MRTLFIIFIMSFSNLCFSQNFLELKKIGMKKKIEFYPGEEIRFKLKNDENFSRAYITGVYDGYMNLNRIKINFEDIERVDIREKSSNTFIGIGKTLFVVSLGYLTIDLVNLTVVRGISLKNAFNQNQALISFSGLTLGISLQFIKKKYFKNKGLNRVRGKKYF